MLELKIERSEPRLWPIATPLCTTSNTLQHSLRSVIQHLSKMAQSSPHNRFAIIAERGNNDNKLTKVDGAAVPGARRAGLCPKMYNET